MQTVTTRRKCMLLIKCACPYADANACTHKAECDDFNVKYWDRRFWVPLARNARMAFVGIRDSLKTDDFAMAWRILKAWARLTWLRVVRWPGRNRRGAKGTPK